MSIVAAELVYASHVPRDYNPRPPNYVFFVLLWLVLQISCGAAQAFACCWINSFITVRNKALQVAIGAGLGIFTAISIPLLAAAVTHLLEALIGIYLFLLTGIVCGSMLGLSQWRQRTCS